MRLLTRFSIPILILAVGFIVMLVLLGMRTEVPRKEPKLRTKIVNTVVVQPQRKTVTVTGLGRVTSSQPVDLYSEVSGTILEGDIPFQPSRSFKKGDLLLKIDDRQARLNLNGAKSDFLTVLAIVLAEIKSDFPDEYESWREYFYKCDFENPIPPLPSAESQRIQMLLTRFNVFKLFFAVNDLEITLEKHNIYAPFDGSIVSAEMRAGSTARNGSFLGAIINLEDLEVELPVTTDDINWIEIGADVRLKSDELKSEWKGRIIRIGRILDPKTQTISVFINIERRDKLPLFSGLYLTAEISGATIDNAISIPRQALYNENHLYLIRDGKLESREVEIARKEFDTVILQGGLVAGDTVIVDLMQGVVPGMPVMSRSLSD